MEAVGGYSGKNYGTRHFVLPSIERSASAPGRVQIGSYFPSAITRFEETETRLGCAAGAQVCPKAALIAFVGVASLTMASVLIVVLGPLIREEVRVKRRLPLGVVSGQEVRSRILVSLHSRKACATAPPAPRASSAIARSP
jgi:hypothetical protein